MMYICRECKKSKIADKEAPYQAGVTGALTCEACFKSMKYPPAKMIDVIDWHVKAIQEDIRDNMEVSTGSLFCLNYLVKKGELLWRCVADDLKRLYYLELHQGEYIVSDGVRDMEGDVES